MVEVQRGREGREIREEEGREKEGRVIVSSEKSECVNSVLHRAES